ncbi:hypothetical protein DFH27DRAFT_604773 [Peziza echinospora]|nr:hypothetical protein DFH27DRAFT_604773 [Peziza echinospora]
MGLGSFISNAAGAVASKAASAAHYTWSTVTKATTGLAGLVGLVDTSRATTSVSWLSQAIVRLDLYLDGGDKPDAVGSGFFLNIPGTTQDVIATAGHNLIRPAGPGQSGPQKVSKIDVRYKDGTGKWTVKQVTPANYYIGEPYEKSPSEANAVYDYGVILLDRDGSEPRDSLGFNIFLASLDLNSPELGNDKSGLNSSLGGYPANANSGPGDPELEIANGRFSKHAERQVHYTAPSDKGMSGGPVWVSFGGEAVVVGIHNYHGDKPGEGNRGTRLEITTIQDILKWSKAPGVLLTKALRLSPPAKPAPAATAADLNLADGVFLHSGVPQTTPSTPPADTPCYVFSGPQRDSALTTFDITLAQAFTNSSKHKGAKSTAPQTYQYAISYGTGAERRYLHFNTDSSTAPDQVTGTKVLSLGSLVKFKPTPPPAISAFAFDPTKHRFKILVQQNHDEGDNSTRTEWKLLMSPHDIPPADDPFEQERARPGLLLKKIKNRGTLFEDFLLAD